MSEQLNKIHFAKQPGTLRPIDKKPFDSKEISAAKKISTAAKRVFSSPTFWASLLLMGVIIFTPAGIHLAVPMHTIIQVYVFAAAALFLLTREFKETMQYETSLWYNMLRNKINPEKNPWYSEIKIPNQPSGKLWLGAIPLKDKNHQINLADKEMKLVVLSVIKRKELTTPTPFSDPVTPDDWKDLSIAEHKIIEAKDFEVPTDEQIKEGVNFIEQQTRKGKTLYVHCKAGKGRSAIIVACYLLKQINGQLEKSANSSKLLNDIKKELSQKKQLNHPNDMVLTIIDFIKMQRPSVSLTKVSKIAGLKAYCQRNFKHIKTNLKIN